MSVKDKVYYSNDVVDDYEYNLSDRWKKNDTGVVLGAGWDITEHLIIDANYYLGLTDIRDFERFATKTRSLRIGFGYRF